LFISFFHAHIIFIYVVPKYYPHCFQVHRHLPDASEHCLRFPHLCTSIYVSGQCHASLAALKFRPIIPAVIPANIPPV
jgi:hypothetical protein